jgi:hypothetical protein
VGRARAMGRTYRYRAAPGSGPAGCGSGEKHVSIFTANRPRPRRPGRDVHVEHALGRAHARALAPRAKVDEEVELLDPARHQVLGHRHDVEDLVQLALRLGRVLQRGPHVCADVTGSRSARELIDASILRMRTPDRPPVVVVAIEDLLARLSLGAGSVRRRGTRGACQLRAPPANESRSFRPAKTSSLHRQQRARGPRRRARTTGTPL